MRVIVCNCAQTIMSPCEQPQGILTVPVALRQAMGIKCRRALLGCSLLSAYMPPLPNPQPLSQAW